MMLRVLGKLLGLLDIAALIVIWVGIQPMMWRVSAYFIFKGLLFLYLTNWTDLFSWTDFLHGSYYAFALLTGIQFLGVAFLLTIITTAKALWSIA